MNPANEETNHGPSRYLPILVLGGLLVWLPYYVGQRWNPNLMDDVGWMLPGNLPSGHSISSNWSWVRDHVREDGVVYGRVRPFWIAHQVVIYKVAIANQLAARLLRLLEFFAALFFWVMAFRNYTPGRWWMLALSLSCPYLYDTLFAMSTQEMWVVFFLGLYVWAAWDRCPTWRSALARLLAGAGACLSKEPSAVYLIAYLVAELICTPNARDLRRRPSLWLELILWSLWLALVSHLGKTGSYTGGAFHWSLTRLVASMKFFFSTIPRANPMGMLLFGGCGLWILTQGRLFCREGWLKLRIWSPVILGALAYWALLALWGRASYLLGPLALMTSAPLACLVWQSIPAKVSGAFWSRGVVLSGWFLLIGCGILASYSITRRMRANTEIATMIGFMRTAYAQPKPLRVYYPREHFIGEQVFLLDRIVLSEGLLERARTRQEKGDIFLLYHTKDAPLTPELEALLIQPNLYNTATWRIALARPEAAALCLSFPISIKEQ